MNSKSKLAVMAGVGLAVNAALSVGTVATPQIEAEHPQSLLQLNTVELDGSFLKVSASCKSSHAAFDAVSVGLEDISKQVISIHAEVEQA